MGNCVSSHKSQDMKPTVQIQSPNKENNTVKPEQDIVAGAGHSFLPQTEAMGHVDGFRSLSSEEETFFDSHLLLDSDCEDYFSVNGDFTPSRSNTPVHQKSFIEAPPQPHTSSEPDSISKPSPTETKKQLFELFRESFHDNPAEETTPFRVSRHWKENSAVSAQCCIPSFKRSMSFSDRKKMRSPANTNGW